MEALVKVVQKSEFATHLIDDRIIDPIVMSVRLFC